MEAWERKFICNDIIAINYLNLLSFLNLKVLSTYNFELIISKCTDSHAENAEPAKNVEPANSTKSAENAEPAENAEHLPFNFWGIFFSPCQVIN